MKVKALKKRADEAWQKRQLYDRTLRDVYDYVMPMRDVTGLHTGQRQTEGASRVDKVFDATAIKAAFRFAGRLQTELTPIFQPFFSLEAGPIFPDSDEKKAFTEELQRIGSIAMGVLASGSFHNSSHEMYVDLYAGTGYMFIAEGDDLDPVRFRVVPVPEMAIEEGPWGKIEHWYWKREWRADQLPVMWPKGEFSEKVRNLIKDHGDKKVVVCQYTYYDAETRDYKLLVWCDESDDNDPPFWKETFRTSPWISPRFFKVPGEDYGRGPAQLAMPFIKTANKAREMALKAAALAIMGVWMRRNDGVFNPDTVEFKPLAMWPVASTGGPLGPTLQRLPVPQDFDISTIVMADEREQMKQALFDDALPPEAGAVRSATEIAERMSRLSQDLSGVYGRLTLEIVVPLVQRVVDILERRGYLKNAEGKSTSITIDQLLTQVRVVSPIAAGQQAAKVQSAVNWIEMLSMLGGGPEAAAAVAKVEDLGPQIGRWLGVEDKFIRSKQEQEELQKKAEQAQQAQAQAGAQQQAEAAAPPEQPFINGGGV